MLNPDTCYQALSSRDARFDGRFFLGVRTTGVYCRPVCSARRPKRENVEFFACAAAAAGAGYRPCKRCRPETAPGTPAWSGTSATVSRALRLIDGGALDEGRDVASLAERLGVGERQLRRLFQEHLGTSPLAVAQTRRVHFARRMLDQTDLAISEIALAAGFSSLRRFNAAMKDHFGASPTELRKAGRQASVAKATGQTRRDGAGSGPARAPVTEADPTMSRVLLRLAYHPPYDWDTLLEFLRYRNLPAIEEVRDDTYRRIFRLSAGGKTVTGLATVSHVEARSSLLVDLKVSDPAAIQPVTAHVHRMFDLGADPDAIARHLAADPLLAPILEYRRGLRVPGAWDPFEVAVRAIVGQQVSVAGACTIARRIVDRLGQPLEGLDDTLNRTFPEPEVVADANLENIGMPGARVQALKGLAQAISEGRVRLDGTVPVEDTMESLVALPGIGPWTAGYIAMRTLGEPDAMPTADLGLLKAVPGKKGKDRCTPKELAERSERWRPWRAYAALLLWNAGTRPDSGG